MKIRYPVCAVCDIEINPWLYEDCEKTYTVDGECYCRSCFRDWLIDWMDTSLDEVAECVGVMVSEVEDGRRF